MAEVFLAVSVPIAGFRLPWALDFWETYPVPPPSTAYGFLLSLVGEPDRQRHAGTEVAIGLLQEGAISTVLRTAWRTKDGKAGPGVGNNRTPVLREVLTGLAVAIGVRTGTDPGHPALVERVQAVMNGAWPDRFGGLSLGESTFLVNDVSLLREPARWLAGTTQATITMPIWADQAGFTTTRWGQFEILTQAEERPPSSAWVRVEPGPA